ncbi:hypothetical protein CO612_03195 [Lysobacteraceae bacterium NML71-0210]|nr:hypothetical protein CO612_03195 [Xanthomonadaceae bacterium NML71-0210]
MLKLGDVAAWQGADGQWRLLWMLAHDAHAQLGGIYSLAQFILMMDEDPQALTQEELDSLRQTERLGHFPIAAEQLQAANLKVVGHMQPSDEDMSGYRVWRAAFDQGKAGVFTVPLEDIWQIVLESLAQGAVDDDGDE